LLENMFDRKSISANPSPNPYSNPNPKALITIYLRCKEWKGYFLQRIGFD